MSDPTRNVLLVDSHEVVRWDLRMLLEARGNFKIVAEAGDAKAALEAAIAVPPDIAILEYSLPSLNGRDLTLALKSEVPQIEILFYTMYKREDLVLDALRAGARGYALKSDSLEELLIAIDTVCAHKPYLSSALPAALIDQSQNASATSKGTLTPREREIVRLVAEGKINKQVAYLLDISIKTVEAHRETIMRKLNLHTAAELVRWAVRNDIVRP